AVRPRVRTVDPHHRRRHGLRGVQVVGSRLDPQSLAAVEAVRTNPELLARLAEPRAIAVDESELGRLGVRAVGDAAEVFGLRVRVVGVVKGYKSLGGPYAFCSLDTGRELMRYQPGAVTYLVARCRDPSDAPAVARR